MSRKLSVARRTLQWSKGITVRDWWRWALRGAAVLALVAGGVLLALHPTASYQPASDTGYPPVATTSCLSPFNRLTGYQATNHLGDLDGPYIPPQVQRAASAACSAATNDREHIVEALGIGAVLLIGLSFLPRRRVLATKPLAFSRL